ncbi:MAG: hypothetical protein GY714_18300 [Desulfobacterales bacterium]|nr:hypothetical protein [Desulfobacterales bacterium]
MAKINKLFVSFSYVAKNGGVICEEAFGREILKYRSIPTCERDLQSIESEIDSIYGIGYDAFSSTLTNFVQVESSGGI